MTIDPVRFGRHDAQLEAIEQRLHGLEDTVFSIDKKLEFVIVALAEKRGERRAVGWVAGAVGTVVSIIIAVVSRLFDR